MEQREPSNGGEPDISTDSCCPRRTDQDYITNCKISPVQHVFFRSLSRLLDAWVANCLRDRFQADREHKLKLLMHQEVHQSTGIKIEFYWFTYFEELKRYTVRNVQPCITCWPVSKNTELIPRNLECHQFHWWELFLQLLQSQFSHYQLTQRTWE